MEVNNHRAAFFPAPGLILKKHCGLHGHGLVVTSLISMCCFLAGRMLAMVMIFLCCVSAQFIVKT